MCATLGLKYLDLGFDGHLENLSEFIQSFPICEELLSSMSKICCILASSMDHTVWCLIIDFFNDTRLQGFGHRVIFTGFR